MTEPAFPVERGEHQRIDRPELTMSSAGLEGSGLTAIEETRTACRSLAIFGSAAGWGLAVVGILSAALNLVDLAGAETQGPAAWIRAVLAAASELLAFVLAGWGVAVFSRVTAASIQAYLERVARVPDHLSTQASQGLAILERIAEAMDKPAEPAESSPTLGLERARSIAEITRATSAADWVEAETRLREFNIAFPEDPALSSLTESLAKARNNAIRDRLAQLDAARAVNDPDRVLDLYHDVGPALEDPRRAELDQDLGRWFLSLIHRRLRTGKVQSDVVRLAERFAESFAATVEGASVRASLPTLRRSVGLCPRCAQPYTGVAEACPKCKKAASQSISAAPSIDEADLTE